MGRIAYPPKRHTFNLYVLQIYKKRMGKGYVETKKIGG